MINPKENTWTRIQSLVVLVIHHKPLTEENTTTWEQIFHFMEILWKTTVWVWEDICAFPWKWMLTCHVVYAMIHSDYNYSTTLQIHSHSLYSLYSIWKLTLPLLTQLRIFFYKSQRFELRIVHKYDIETFVSIKLTQVRYELCFRYYLLK